MLKGHPQICLYQPEIPQNTGNIARLAAATQSRLHLIKPFGFSVSDKNLRRPGLDYWPYLDLEIHQNFDGFISAVEPSKLAFLSVRGEKSYLEMPCDVEYLVFGQETKGLPSEIWESYSGQFYHIPIFHPKVRSLNLANAASIVVYHYLSMKHEIKEEK